MKNYYFVSWNHGEGIYCTNLATAESAADIYAAYSGRDEVTVRRAEECEIESAKRRGMPVTDCPHIEPKPEPVNPELPEGDPEPETEPETEGQTDGGTVYRIRENSEYGSREVYFDGKPAAETREALKALKMRWNHKKLCWYGYASEGAIISAIQGAELKAEPEAGAVVVTDGYLGGGAIYGAKSNRALYGADLSAAIRADLKAAGIKGVTVSCESYSMGQTIHATITIERNDLTEAPTADPNRYYLCELERILYRWNYWHIGGESVTLEQFQQMTEEEKTAIALQYQREEREKYGKRRDLNTHRTEPKDCPEFTAAFLAKINRVLAIIQAYHYDASNSMVDYFDTNFYYDLHTKPGKSWAA